MRIVTATLLLAFASPALAQQQDASQAIALQIGQLVITNAQLAAQNAQLQSRVEDLSKKLAAVSLPTEPVPVPPAK